MNPQSLLEASSSFSKSSTLTLIDHHFIKSWLSGKAFLTQKAYLRIGKEFLEYISPLSLKESTLFLVQNFIEGILPTQSPETKKLRGSVIKSLFSFGVSSGYLKVNVTSFLPKLKMESYLTERYLTEEEVFKMITLTRNRRDHILLKTLYSAGLRVSELVNLNWDQIQSREKGSCQIVVIGKGNKKRTVVLGASYYELFLKLQPMSFKASDPVFTSRENKRLSVRRVQMILKEASIRAGIPKKVSPHWFRHAHASHALDRGAPLHLVQSTLGHASIVTTSKYLHARPTESSSKYLGI